MAGGVGTDCRQNPLIQPWSRRDRRVPASSTCEDGLVTELLRPLVGYIPSSEFGSNVVGPPSALLTSEQKNAAKRDPLSFRYTAGRKAGGSQQEALSWLEGSVGSGALLPIGPSVVVYRQSQDENASTGILADLSIAAYDSGQVKPHERTIAVTRRKMAEYMRTTRMYGNPPVTAAPPDVEFEEIIAAPTSRPPDSAFKTVDGTLHELWVVDGGQADELCSSCPSAVYITDGHHRLASASVVAAEESRSDARIPAGVFPPGEFRLRSYARCLSDPGLDPDVAVARLAESLEIAEVAPEDAVPGHTLEFGAKIGSRHFLIRIPDNLVPHDHYASLNTNLLQNLILAPVFGIENPRTDKRLQFVADLGDTPRTCTRFDAWLLPYPLLVSDVMTVADSSLTMPAKSTWLAPKLPSGLVIRPIGGHRPTR